MMNLDYSAALESFRAFCKHGNEIFALPLLIFSCLFFGFIAKKVRLPSLTGFILGGIAVGTSGLDLISDRTFESLEVFNHVALGLMAMTIGTHLNFRRLRSSGRRVLVFSLFETGCTFLCVYFTSRHFIGASPEISLVLAAVSMSTAPITTIALVREAKARGALVNTLMPVVALNNVLSILCFGFIVKSLEAGSAGLLKDPGHWRALALPELRYFFYSIGIGAGTGIVLKWISGRKHLQRGELLTGVFFMVMAGTGISLSMGLNPMLACLFMGIVISNSGKNREEIITAFDEIQHFIIVLFFGMAGMHVRLEMVFTAGLAAVFYFLARAAGKVSGPLLGGMFTRSPGRVKRHLGITLLPQAGLAVGLIIIARGVPALSGSIDFLTAVVLAAVAMNEIMGPPVVKWAFASAREANRARARLIEFIDEEFIQPRVRSTSKNLAILELSDFLVKSHNLPPSMTDVLGKLAIERESLISTGIGEGIAVPHGIIEEGKKIWGVIGLSREGIKWEAVDGKPVHLVFLIITPKKFSGQHLRILAEIAKLTSDPDLRSRLFTAQSAVGLYEIIHREESHNINYFLEKDRG